MSKVTAALDQLSLRELAKRSGTTSSFISRLFRGQRDARVDTLRRIADALAVSIDELDKHLAGVKSKAGFGRHGWIKGNSV